MVAVLRTPPRALFLGERRRSPAGNRVRLRLQPDAGVTFTLLAKEPGAGTSPVPVPVAVDFRRCSGRCTRPTNASSPTP